MASYLDKLRDIVEDWQDVLDILKLNEEHFDIAINEAYSVLGSSDYAEDQLLAAVHTELTHQLHIEEMTP